MFVKNTTGNLAYLNLWIDANSNGLFDNNENASISVPSGTNGNMSIPLNSINGLTSGNSYYARLRLSTTQNLPPSGFAADGEVEDHWINIYKTTLTTNPLNSCVGSTINFSAISGMLNYNWTGPNGFTSNQQNPVITNSNTNHNGIYTLTVTTPGGCSISDSTNVIVNPLPTAPIIGAITQPSCAMATGSVALSGLPAAGTWTVTASPGGNSISGTGTNVLFTALNANTNYTFVVTNAAGCSSVASANVSIATQPITPLAPIIDAVTQPSCLMATGSVALSGLPAAGTWTVTASPGGNSISGTGTNVLFTALNANTNYTFVVTNAAGCSSIQSINITINNSICAVTETTAPINGLPGGTTAPLTANDTLNGVNVTIGTAPGNVKITAATVPTGSGLIVNPDGTVSIPPNTPSGTYTVNYTICEINNPTNCSNVNSNILVISPSINAQNDTFVTTNGSIGGIVGSIFSNNGNGIDLANGAQAALNNVTLTVPIWSGQSVPYINANGYVIVPPGTPSGEYSIGYTICMLNPFQNICDKATVTIQVEPEKGDEIVIYNHMTPNGDGYNDIFLIDGIDKFPNNTV
ncbi:GEVED domain-containing protein, partial [Flavobacterium oreochromis]